MSLEMPPFDRSRTSSYWHCIVIMALSCIVSEIKRVIHIKIAIFNTPAFDAPFRGSMSEYCRKVGYQNTRMVWLSDGKKVSFFTQYTNAADIRTDRQTDGRTDAARRHRQRLCIASRRKNKNILRN